MLHSLPNLGWFSPLTPWRLRSPPRGSFALDCSKPTPTAATLNRGGLRVKLHEQPFHYVDPAAGTCGRNSFPRAIATTALARQ